jgi:hypothetical protein
MEIRLDRVWQHDRVPDSPALAQARRHAETLAEAGNLDGAQALLERAIEIGRAQLAQGDTELLSTMRQLAGIHMRADDPMSARRVLEEAIEVGHRLDEADPLAVLLAHDLAVVAEELANRHVARSQYAKVAALGPAALGEDHPAVTRARAYLGPDQPAPAVPSAPAVPPAPVVASPLGEPAVEAPEPPAPETARRSRRSWVFAGAAAGVAVVVAAAILLRPGDPAVPAAAAPSAPTASEVPSRTPGAAPATRTAIAAPADNSTVPYPFDATFTVSAADATATDTVIALSICVAGHCYLDGRLDLYDGVAAPYTIYLGSTAPEGSGVAWRLRLDRLTTSAFTTLIAERDAAIAAGTWGDTSTRMNALNPTPVSTLTVTKGS